MKKTSKVWDLVPVEHHDTLRTILLEFSKSASEWVQPQLVLTPGALAIVEKAKYPPIESYYTYYTAESLLKFLIVDLQIVPLKNFKKPSKKKNDQQFTFELINTLATSITALGNKYESKALDRRFNKKRKIEYIFRYRCMLIDCLSFINFNTSIHELLKKAKSGDDASLLKAIRADRLLMHSEIARKRISKAVLSKDEGFLISLGQSIQNPLGHNKERSRNFGEMLIALFALALSNKQIKRVEILKFIKDLGLRKPSEKNPVTELESFTRSINRYLTKIPDPIKKRT